MESIYKDMLTFFLHGAFFGFVGGALLAQYMDSVGLFRKPDPPAVLAPPLSEKAWIVTDYEGGGVRGVFTSQADAEAEIATICAAHPDLRRHDFVVVVDRIRQREPAVLGPQPEEWRPIETEPPPEGEIVLGFLRRLPERWLVYGTGFWSLGEWHWQYQVPHPPATHWMPRPDPPAALGHAGSVPPPQT